MLLGDRDFSGRVENSRADRNAVARERQRKRRMRAAIGAGPIRTAISRSPPAPAYRRSGARRNREARGAPAVSATDPNLQSPPHRAVPSEAAAYHQSNPPPATPADRAAVSPASLPARAA